MKSLLSLSLLALLMCAPARAAEVEVAHGAVCDTQRQAERLATVFGKDAEGAIQTVNTEAHDPNACGMASVAFVRGARIAKVQAGEATFEIVEVLVVGVMTPVGVQPAPPTVYYSVFKLDERVA